MAARAPAGRPTTRQSGGGGRTHGRSLVRGLRILELVRDRSDSVAVADVIAALRLPRATAYALIRVLLQEGFLEAGSADGRYVIGRQAYRVGLGYRGDAALLRAARPILATLRDETRETVQLSVLDRDRNLVLLREEGTGRVGFIMPVGSYAPVNWSASGCLLVSDFDDAELHARIGPTIEPSPTGLAPTDMAAVVREIRRFRAQGYGVKIGHANAKVAMIAAPVRDPSGRCVAAITVVAYELSLDERRRRALVAAVRRSAAALGARLAPE